MQDISFLTKFLSLPYKKSVSGGDLLSFLKEHGGSKDEPEQIAQDLLDAKYI